MFFVRFGGGLSLRFFLLLQFPKVSLSPQAFFFQFFRGSKRSDFSAKHEMASLGINTFRQECCRLIPFTTTEHADQFFMLNPFNWGLAYVICYAKCPASPDFSSYMIFPPFKISQFEISHLCLCWMSSWPTTRIDSWPEFILQLMKKLFKFFKF